MTPAGDAADLPLTGVDPVALPEGADRRGRAPGSHGHSSAEALQVAASFGKAVGALPPGRVLPVVTAPETVLSRPGARVEPTDPVVVQLAADLLATMRVSPGCVGLAAPQAGVSVQLFAVDVTGHPKASTVHGPFVLANAVIVEASRWKAGREGCMSVPDLTGDVKRAGRLVVEGQLPGSGMRIVIETEAFEARALQHEIDHCQGLLFLDRVSGAHAVYQRKVYL